MMLPVSSYEELLASVRSLTCETIQLRHEITTSLQASPAIGSSVLATNTDCGHHSKNHSVLLPRRTLLTEDLNTMNVSDYPDNVTGEKADRTVLLLDKKENETDIEFKEIDEKLTSPDVPFGKDLFHQNGWAQDTLGLWHSGPSSLNLGPASSDYYQSQQDLTLSVTSNSHEPQSLNSFSSSSKRTYSHQQLGAKVEMVYSLLSMLDTGNREDMSKTFLAMSSSTESCHAMRQSGCLPLLIQLIHSSELNKEVRKRAAEALHNIVHAQTDEKRRRREIRVLKLLEHVREYCDELKNDCAEEISQSLGERHPINSIGTLMKFSFDAEHRQAICILGGLHAVAQLLQVDHEAHGSGSTNDNSICITLRRYAGMSLTNLTFGDGKNKALLCSLDKFMRALVDQLKSPSEDLRQVTASVLRNLSWRADAESKQTLRNVGAVTALTVSAMEGKKESTLKSILSALWNLSAHCSLNKIDICSVPGALAFLVKMLRYKSSSNTLSIVENAGGILRNISSHIAVREDYRQILRDHNCFEVLLEQLKSPSLTVVSNACGTLWNLSARCPEDQKRLWEMGATTMLRSLVQSKHKMISMGSSAALKNLLAANPDENLLAHLDSTAKSLGLQNLPTLFVRKKRALEQELNITLAETCDNIDPLGSPIHTSSPQEKILPKRSESRDSVQSTQSDSAYERLNQITLKNEEKVLENKNVTLHDSLDEKSTFRKTEDQKLMRRYNKSSMIPTPTFKKINQDRLNEKTKEEAVLENKENERVDDVCFKERAKTGSKEKNNKGIPVLDTRISIRANQSYEVLDENFSLLSTDDTSTCEASAGQKCHQIPNSETRGKVTDLRKNTDSRIQIDKVAESKQSNNQKKSERDNENFKNPKEIFDDEKFSSVNNSFERNNAIIRNKINNGFPQNDNKNVIIGHDLCEEETTSSNAVSSLVSHRLTTRHFSKDMHSEVAESVGIKKVSAEESLPHSNKAIESKKERLTTNENFFSSVEAFTSESRLRDDKPSHNSLATSLKLSQQCSSLDSLKLKNEDHQHQEIIHRDMDSRSVLAENSESTFLSYDGLNYELDKSKTLKSPPKSEQVMFAPVSPENSGGSFFNAGCESNNQIIMKVSTDTKDEDEDDGNVKSLNDQLCPKFKVGFPLMDSSVLQMEANKICCEIKKQQDFEMGCSLTSEVSLVSCSSFLDTGDYSLFDSSTDAIDFDDSDNLLLGKISSKMRSCSSRKNNSYQVSECLSLPSLGSLKNEQLDTLDMDNSVLSVASITSEIAETYSKDPEAFKTFPKTSEKIYAEDGLMEEAIEDVTLISNEDDTLNADSFQNNAEFYDEDSSLHSQENLPFDSENASFEKTSDLIHKKLTPKEKRKTFQERYRTYVIRDTYNSKSGKDLVANLIDLNDKNDPIGCIRQSNQLDCNSIGSEEWKDENFDQRNGFESGRLNKESQKFDSPSVTFQKGNKYEKFCFSKSFDREDDKNLMSDFIFDSRSLNSLLSIGPAERKELVDNAKLVAFSLKTAVQEGSGIVSDSEAEDDYKSVEIDTATYNKNYRDRFLSEFSTQDLQNLQQNDGGVAEGDTEKKGARILKPTDEMNENLEFSKGIRGRRKPLYSSPQKNLSKTTSSPLNLPKISRTASGTKKPPTDPCKSPVLCREGTFTKGDDTSDLKKVEAKNLRAIPVLHKKYEPKSLNSSRPFGKNKSALSGENSKRPGENQTNQTSKIGRPLSSYASKNIEKRTESDSSQKRPFSAASGIRMEGDKTATSRRPLPSSLSSAKIKSSSSNQNIKAGSSSGSGFSVKSRNPTLQSSKSQSDASLNFSASKDKDLTGTERPPKKEATSKIASLWRKVEETKQRNLNLKDERVWICPEKNVRTSEEVIAMQKKEVLDIPRQKTVHGFPCKASADEMPSHFRTQETDFKKCREFTNVRDSEERRGKTEKRKIISAVIPPFNYNPPAAPALLSKIKHVDTFTNGSLKVTTV